MKKDLLNIWLRILDWIPTGVVVVGAGLIFGSKAVENNLLAWIFWFMGVSSWLYFLSLVFSILGRGYIWRQWQYLPPGRYKIAHVFFSSHVVEVEKIRQCRWLRNCFRISNTPDEIYALGDGGVFNVP